MAGQAVRAAGLFSHKERKGCKGGAWPCRAVASAKADPDEPF